MASKYLVHFITAEKWVASIVHTIAGSDGDAVDQAAEQYFGTKTLPEGIKAVAQVVGDVADEEKDQAVADVEAEPVPVSVAEVETEAEKTAAALLANLPADVLAALRKEAAK